MGFSRFDLTKILLSFLLTLGFLFAGWFIYQEFGVKQPLHKEVLAVSGVKKAEVAKAQGRLTVTVDIGEVERIQPFYQEIMQVLPREEAINVTVRDRRNDYLLNLWRHNRFAMEEAAAKGNFTEMQLLIENNLSKEKVDYWLLEVDGENLYLQIHDGGYYLYEIVRRVDKT